MKPTKNIFLPRQYDDLSLTIDGARLILPTTQTNLIDSSGVDLPEKVFNHSNRAHTHHSTSVRFAELHQFPKSPWGGITSCCIFSFSFICLSSLNRFRRSNHFRYPYIIYIYMVSSGSFSRLAQMPLNSRDPMLSIKVMLFHF